MSSTAALPPGQTETEHHRFGLPRFARVRPQPSAAPMVTVGGSVRRPAQLSVGELLDARWRAAQVSDLHCVTTWTARGLHWEGVPFRQVHAMLRERVDVVRSATWITFVGLDGYRSCLRLSDAVADNVLLADRLDGAPLTGDRGGPVRLIAPAHYGYKGVKHVCGIEYRGDYDPGSARWAAHPRGRVRYEERSRYLPGPLWRQVWRRALPRVQQRYARA